MWKVCSFIITFWNFSLLWADAGHSNCTLVSDLVKNTTTCLDRLIPSDRKPGELSRNKCFNYHPHPEPLIVGIGGSPSLSQEFRHMAAIGYGDEKDIQWLCGGSLISKRFILTAAHCLSSKIGEAKYVRLGDLDISTDKDDAQPQNFTILKRIPHPSFKPSETYHDIALLHLDREPLFTAYVSPACLNTRRDLPIFNDEMTATGWGKVGFSGESSNILIKVRLDYVPYDKCVQSFMKKNGRLYTSLLSNGIVDDLQICAGGVIGVDTCQGDSGGPLQVLNVARSAKGRVHTIIGITSFGKACGLSKAPGIYTRVSNYIPWIESIAWENETWSK